MSSSHSTHVHHAAPSGQSSAHSAAYPDTRAKGHWSWQFASLAGIPVKVHATFLLLLAWIALSHISRGHGLIEMLSGVLLIVALFACVVLHELGHALVARRFGIRTRDITLLPIGGVAKLERMPEKPSQELLVALAGPAVSYALAGVLFAAAAVVGAPSGLSSLHLVGGPFLTKLMWINVTLASFNLLPAFPMDGGRALRAALAMRLDRQRATELAARLGQSLALLLAFFGFLYNPLLILIAGFVWIGARDEASIVQIKSALSGVPVSAAMIREFHTLERRDSLAHAAELALASVQHDFPVLDEDGIAGLLTRANLLQGLSQQGADASVEGVMQTEFDIAAPSEPLEPALERLQQSPGRVLIVVRGDEVVGLLTPENIAEMLTMKSALRESHGE
jgi:Zn-dependent protease/predicted transcriptional regulator